MSKGRRVEEITEPTFETLRINRTLTFPADTYVATASMPLFGITTIEAMNHAANKAFDLFHNTLRRGPDWERTNVRYWFTSTRAICEIMETPE